MLKFEVKFSGEQVYRCLHINAANAVVFNGCKARRFFVLLRSIYHG